MKKIVIYISLIIVVFVATSLVIPKSTSPPKDTRVILEHTYESYIAPPCFEQSDPTNDIDETNLAGAKELGYPPHDTCTEDALEEEKDSLMTALLKKSGILHTKWDEW